MCSMLAESDTMSAERTTNFSVVAKCFQILLWICGFEALLNHFVPLDNYSLTTL